MSASNAPTYYFSGIQFNSSFYNPSTSSLTQSQASALYLLKNTADTATALESFTGGILTNNITPTTTSSTISLNSSKIGSTNADPAIAIATSDLTRTIKIGNESGTNQNSVHLANLDVTYNNINNIVGTTGIVQIGNKQTTTTGVLYLGCSTAGNVRTSAPINIGTDTTMTGAITIGSTNATQSTVIKNADITMGTGKNITLQPTASYVAPTALTMLGGITDGVWNTPGSSFSSTKDIATITLVKGTYMVYFACQCDGNPGTLYVDLPGTALPSINTVPAMWRFGASNIVTGSNLGISGSFPYSCTTGGTIILRCFIGGTVTSIPLYKFQAVRIA